MVHAISVEFVTRFQDVIFARKPAVVLRDVGSFLELVRGLKKAKSNISQTMRKHEAHETLTVLSPEEIPWCEYSNETCLARYNFLSEKNDIQSVTQAPQEKIQACEQALRGALAAGRKKEGELATGI